MLLRLNGSYMTLNSYVIIDFSFCVGLKWLSFSPRISSTERQFSFSFANSENSICVLSPLYLSLSITFLFAPCEISFFRSRSQLSKPNFKHFEIWLGWALMPFLSLWFCRWTFHKFLLRGSNVDLAEYRMPDEAGRGITNIIIRRDENRTARQGYALLGRRDTG